VENHQVGESDPLEAIEFEVPAFHVEFKYVVVFEEQIGSPGSIPDTTLVEYYITKINKDQEGSIPEKSLQYQHNMRKRKIVVIGGGTGTFTVLSGLKMYRKEERLDLSAVVSMSDDGGSTGLLRDELGVLPPGDIRQCLVALSTSGELMRKLMNYRFPKGALEGHNFGNLLLSALEKVTGDFGSAVEKTSEILRCEGKIIPVTLSHVSLRAELQDGKEIIGQRNVLFSDLSSMKKISLTPKAKSNPRAVKAILEADVVVIGPGEFYTSIIPNLLVPGIPEALKKTKAKKVFVCNLMKRSLHTKNFFVEDFAKTIEKFITTDLDVVVYNNKVPPKALVQKYAREGEFPVDISVPKKDINSHISYIGGDLLNKKIMKPAKGDLIARNLIRHNPEKLAKLILKILK
jgi:uncharacterized cofD-like protein